ncbi:MAG: SLOG family protein [Clostridia bacterium]
MIEENGVTEFWTGNYGGFDRCAALAIRDVKKTYPHIRLVLVLPYLTKAVSDYKEDYYEKYDAIVIAYMPEKTPARLRIIKANEYMVDNCDFLVCNVEHSWGGAAKTMEYAERKIREIWNLVVGNKFDCC